MVMLLGIPVVGLGVLAALIALNITVWTLGYVPPVLVIGTAVAALGLVRALVHIIRPVPDPPGEILVPATEEPELHAYVGDLADRAGTRRPDRIAVVADANAYVYETGALLGMFRGRRTLAVGAPLIDTLTVSELRGVLAHELGHFVGGDTRTGPLSSRTRLATLHLVSSSSSAMRLAFGGYLRLLLRVDGSISRRQEFVADRTAVRLAGREPCASALWKMEHVAVAQQDFLRRFLVPVVRSGALPPVPSGFRAYLAEPGRWAELSLEGAPAPPGTRWDTHPPLEARLAQIASIPDADGGERDHRAGAALFRDSDRWQQLAFAWRCAQVDRSQRLTPVPWEHSTESIDTRQVIDTAGAADAALSSSGFPTGVAGLREALQHDPSRFAAALRSRQPGMQGGDRDQLLRAATRALVQHEQLQAGGRLRFSWSGTATTTDAAGVPVDVDTQVERLLATTSAIDATSPAGTPPAPSQEPFPAGPRSGEARPGSVPTARPSHAPFVASATVRHPPLPPAPVPPFEQLPDSSVRVASASRLLGRSSLTFAPDRVVLGDTAVPYAAIEHVRLALRDKEVQVVVEVGGRSTKYRSIGSTVADQRRAAATFVYAWSAFEVMVAPHLVDAAMGALRSGRTVKIGKLEMTVDGVGAPRRPRVPWTEVGDPRSAPPGELQLDVGGSTVKVKFDQVDAVILTTLIATARIAFS